MKNYSTVQVCGRLHVVCDTEDRNKSISTGERIPPPDYRGTGKALCGVIPKGEDLAWWLKKHKNILGKEQK